MSAAYGTDLAYIHDAGHGAFARDAAPGLLEHLRHAGKTAGRVVDLGCGSGIWAEILNRSGYDVLGIDISPAMIALARQRVPRAEFRVGSYRTADLPPCVAVTSIGECLSYLFDHGNTAAAPRGLFRRVADALEPGGLFLFDMVGPGRVPGGSQRQFREADDWAVLVTTQEDPERRRLTRRITSFRKVGELYRRDHEVHRLRLADRAELAADLRQAGFRVRLLAGYGALRFGPGHFGVLARKA